MAAPWAAQPHNNRPRCIATRDGRSGRSSKQQQQRWRAEIQVAQLDPIGKKETLLCLPMAGQCNHGAQSAPHHAWLIPNPSSTPPFTVINGQRATPGYSKGSTVQHGGRNWYFGGGGECRGVKTRRPAPQSSLISSSILGCRHDCALLPLRHTCRTLRTRTPAPSGWQKTQKVGTEDRIDCRAMPPAPAGSCPTPLPPAPPLRCRSCGSWQP